MAEERENKFMTFDSPEKILSTIRASDEVERWRSENRAKINAQANGVPPLTEEQAKKMGLRVRVNWGEMATLFQDARRQYQNAFQSRGKFFKVSIPSAPVEKQVEWEQFITQFINRVMKKSRKYYEQGRSIWASVVPHGIGPSLWEDQHSWCPGFAPLEDLRIPTDTYVNLENLEWFAVRKSYTPGELARKVFGKNASPNWDKPSIKKILHEYHDKNWENVDFNWSESPEKMYEQYKQNLGFYTSDAVPTIPLWHFFYLDDADPKATKWKLCVVPTAEIQGGTAEYKDFLYKSAKPFALDISHILHLQTGDLSTKPPFMVQSVRSLGFLLMEPCFWTNLTRCRLLQHTLDTFNPWFRVSDPAGKSRAQKIELYDKAIVPEGVSLVPNTERHQIDAGLVSGVMEELKGLQQRVSLAYTQDTEGPSGNPETATAVMARVTAVNAMMTGLLNTAFRYETFKYQEICRRFCLRKSDDDDVQRFQKACRERGIPSVFVNSDLWDVEPEIPMGAGNPTMEMAMSQQLLGMLPMFNPEAQEEIKHEATAAITGDARKADRWVPVGKGRGITLGQEWALAVFGTLMQGVPAPYKPGIPVVDLIDALLGMIAGVVMEIEQTTGVGTPQQIKGLQTASQHVAGLVQQLAQNKQEGERVKQYGDALGNLDNMIKAFAQRAAEAAAATNGHDPEAEAKANATILQAQTKAKISEETHAQKAAHREQQMEQRQQQFEQKMAQQMEQHMVAIQTKITEAATSNAIKLSEPRKEPAKDQ